MHTAIIILTALYYLVYILNILVFVSALLSWVPPLYNSRIGYILNMLTEPIIAPSRKILYRFEFARSLPFDLSPIVAFLLLGIVSSIIRHVIQFLYLI